MSKQNKLDLKQTKITEKEELIIKLKNLKIDSSLKKILYEDTLNFFGIWESKLYLFNKKNKKIYLPEELHSITIEIVKEYHTDQEFKTFKLITFPEHFLPIYDLFFLDKEKIVNRRTFFDYFDPILKKNIHKLLKEFPFTLNEGHYKINQLIKPLNKKNLFLMIKK